MHQTQFSEKSYTEGFPKSGHIFILGVMEQTDNSTSSVLTPIDDNNIIIHTHAIRKIKRNKRNRRALCHRRMYIKRRSQHAANTPTSMSYPPNQCQKTVASSTPECPNAITCTSTSPLNQQQQTIIPKSSNQPVIASSVSKLTLLMP